MDDSVDHVVTALDAFVAKDDGADAHVLCEILRGVDVRAAWDRLLPAMFGVMERFPEADLGSPGPLVHAIERLPLAQFGSALRDSVRRQPGGLNVWMVNRILNSPLPPDARAEYLALLESVLQNEKASACIRAITERFLRRQYGEDLSDPD